MFVKTIPNKTLEKNRTPEPSDYITWKPSDELLAWLKSRQQLEANASFEQKAVTDPFLQEAMRIFPGLAPADEVVVNGLGTSLSLENAAAGIRALYEQMLDTAWADAKARGDKLPPESQKAIPPTVPGQQ
jgi:hypothetical protein